MNKEIIKKPAYAIVATISAIYGFIIVLSSILAKPYSDEYWMSLYINKYGFWDGFMYWFNNDTAMPIKDFILFVIVGAPSAYLSWDYAVVIPILIVMITVGLIYPYIFSKILKISLNIKQKIIIGLISLSGIMLAPNMNSNFLKMLDNTEDNGFFLYAKFSGVAYNWAPSLVVYLMLISLIIFVAFYLNYKKLSDYKKYLAVAIFGFAVGMTNINIIFTVCTIALFFLISYKWSKNIINFNFKQIIVFILSTSIMTLIVSRFPGNLKRQNSELSEETHTINSVLESFYASSLNDLITLSPYLIATAAAGFSIYLAVKYLFDLKPNKMNALVPIVILFSGIVASICNNILEIIIYKYLWHNMNASVFICGAGLLLGYKLAEILQHNKSSKANTVFTFLALASVTASTLSLYSYVGEAKYRNTKWESQYNNHLGCADISYSWKLAEWLPELSKYRDVPTFTEDSLQWQSCDSNGFVK